MNVAYYCQHVLGVGHFHRSLEICRFLGAKHHVTIILGGPEVHFDEPNIAVFQLPGLRMDDHFSSLIPCDSGVSLDQIKQQRRNELLHFVRTYEPDCLIIELYPLGRKAFRFELDPLLEMLSKSPCKIYCSLRDILVEKKEGREKFEQRAVTTLNKHFDGLLIHADQASVTLNQTFEKAEAIRIPIHYTGFISPRPKADARSVIRTGLKLAPEDRLIVCSLGSGSVGAELLTASAQAFRLLADQNSHYVMQIFTGPYMGADSWSKLLTYRSDNLHIAKFSEQFIDWLAAADLSISMAGYNTFMNVLATGVPALMYPFAQNREQRFRIETLGNTGSITLLEEQDLAPHHLATLMETAVTQSRSNTGVNLDGAATTALIIEEQ